MTIQLKIKYSRPPSQEESEDLWDTFIPTIVKMHLYAGWLSDSKRCSCHIDTTYTELSIGEIIDNLSDFIAEKRLISKHLNFVLNINLVILCPEKTNAGN